MKIDDYSFGRIVIDGKAYTSDVIITPERVESSWWRKEGHRLVPEDLRDVLAHPPAVLVIGTGHDGRMEVPQTTLAALREKGIEVLARRTAEAVAEFNERMKKNARVVAALHLTC